MNNISDINDLKTQISRIGNTCYVNWKNTTIFLKYIYFIDKTKLIVSAS